MITVQCWRVGLRRLEQEHWYLINLALAVQEVDTYGGKESELVQPV
jgi:hypothetical protein